MRSCQGVARLVEHRQHQLARSSAVRSSPRTSRESTDAGEQHDQEVAALTQRAVDAAVPVLLGRDVR